MRIACLFLIAGCVCGQSLAADVMSVRHSNVLLQEANASIDRSDLISSKDSSATSKWMSGFVKTHDGWKSAREIAVSTAAGSEYSSMRTGNQLTAADHIQMANWSRDNKQKDREKAHLFAALTSDRSLVTAQRLIRLGYRNVKNSWVSSERLDQYVREQRTMQESMRLWKKPIERLAKRLAGRNRVAAMTELQAIKDPQAVAAIDLLIGRSSDAGARLAIRILDGIDCYQSSLAMARYACFHDAESIREAAIKSLANRGRAEEFMPGLISLIATPAEAYPIHLEKGPLRSFADSQQYLVGPELIMGFVVKRETDRQVQVLNAITAVDTTITRVRGVRENSSQSGVNLLDVRFLEHRLKQLHALQNVDRMNEKTNKLNQRVGTVLASVTGEEYTDDAKEMWHTWYQNVGLEETETGDKELVEVSEVREEVAEAELGVEVRSECFVAGTPVWTENGRAAIESIQVGDRVLAKNVESGELAYRTVMKTTIRKDHQLTRVKVGDDTILCTSGHRFWHSGAGWVQANQLQPGDLLHTVTGSKAVTAVQEQSPDKTYNLIVDEFHSYFVGEEGLLVQDLLLPTPTNMVVPGLTRFEFQNAKSARP